MTEYLVPLDGSRDSEIAIPHARALAGSDPLHLLTAVWKGEPPAPRKYHEARALNLAGSPAESHVAVEELPSAAVARMAAERPDAVVCMASHGRNALSQAVLGSTAEAYLRAATEPTIIVGPRASFDPARWGARNLVLAVDEPSTAAALAPIAIAMAAHFDFHLWALQAVTPVPYPFAVDASVADDASEATGANELVRLLAERDWSAESKIVVGPDPANAIVQFSDDLPASLVLMGSHTRRGIARIALGSVAMRVVHRTQSPVMIVRL